MSDAGLQAHLAGGACGACGYSTLGLTTLVCPECGADLRTAGVRTPRTPSLGRRRFYVNAVLFTALFALTASITVALFEQLVPKPRQFTYDVRLVDPASRQYKSVTLLTHAVGLGEVDPGLLPVTAEFVPLPPTATTATAPAPAAPPPLVLPPAAPGKPAATPAAVLAWLRTCGVDVTDPRVVVEARWIAADSRAMSRARPGTAWGNYSSSSSGSAPGGSGFDSMFRRERGNSSFPAAVSAAVGLITLALWLAGLWLLRGRAGARATPASGAFPVTAGRQPGARRESTS